VLNVFFTRSLSNLLQNTPVTVNCVNPGLCISNIRRDFTGLMLVVDWFMTKLLARPTEEGGRQLVYAAVGSPKNPEDLKGAYINLHRVDEPSDFVVGAEGKKREDKLWVSWISFVEGVQS
jgi:NAD(P)-dependent dehydrogenase (short-subunit alcohol dehydrogenase family)